MAPTYQPEHGDIYTLADRPALGFSLNGVNRSLTPNPWYTAGETIAKGTVVSIANAAYALAETGNASDAGKIFATNPANVDKAVGICLVASTYGNPIEVQNHGLYTFSTNVFQTGDLGQTVYVAPSPPDPLTNLSTQMTTNRNYAASLGYPLVEIGICVSLNQIFIDFEGDTRGAVSISQIAATAGEAIGNNGTPFLVSVGSDGNAYLADRRKSANSSVATFQVVQPNATNITFSAVTYSNPQAFFSVTSVVGAAAGIIYVAGVGVTITAGDIAGGINSVAARIAGTFFANWSANAVANAITMTQIVFPQNRNTPAGYVIGANAGFQAAGTIPQGTPVVIQKLGAVQGFSGLTAGQPTWLDISGATSQNVATFSVYTDISTLTGYAINSSTIFVSIGQSSQKNDANPIGSIIAQSPSGPDYGYLTCNGAAVSQATYADLFNVIGFTYGNPGGGNFNLPPTFTGGVPTAEIKYLNWYQYNPPVAPVFRYDSGWTQWGALPVGVTSGVIGSYMEIPVSQFGFDPPVTDFFAEVYVQNAGNTIIRQINPNPIYSGSARYGFQIAKDITNNIRLEFADGGLAFYASNGFTAIDATWTYRVFLYKTERFNKFYDYNADKKIQQLWALSLVDFNNSVSTPGPGYFDRSTSAPTGATRLNYSGDFYTNDLFTTANATIGASLSVMGVATHSANVVVNALTLTYATSSISTSGNITTTGSGALTVGGTSTFTGASIHNGTVNINNVLTINKSGTPFVVTDGSSNTKLTIDSTGSLITSGTIASTYTGGSVALSIAGTSTIGGIATFTTGITTVSSVTTNTFGGPVLFQRAIQQQNASITTFSVDTNGNLAVYTAGSPTTQLFASGAATIPGTLTTGSTVTSASSSLSLWAGATTITLGANNASVTVGGVTLSNGTISGSSNVTVAGGNFYVGSVANEANINFVKNGGSLYTIGTAVYLNSAGSGSTILFRLAGATSVTIASTGITFPTVTFAGAGTTFSTNVTAPSFTTSSSRELKKNIKTFKRSALELINSTKVVSYTLKGDKQNLPHVGFIAEDTDELLAGKEHKHMDLTNSIGILMKAIQELTLRLERLETQA